MFKSFFEVHSHNTRNKNNLMQPRGRIEKTKLIGIDLYNLLPLSITNLPINLFGRKIKTVLKQLARYSINEFKIRLEDNAAFVDTSDDFHEFAEGELKNPGTDNEAQVIQGRYSYVGDDGKTYEVEYRADENGFMAAGDHIPKGAAGTVPKGQLGIPSAAAASLAGGGLG
nr:unnamed protein product [Callosobruchus chinensis]